MSRKTVLSRPRTRLYDANYNIGESYYRPALDRLDRKYSGRPLSPPRRQNTPFENVSEKNDSKGEEDTETKKEKISVNGTEKRNKKVSIKEEKTTTKKWNKFTNGDAPDRNGTENSTDIKKKRSFADDIAERHARAFGEEDLETSRRRASKHIQEQHLFDSRGALIARRAIDNFENDLNDESTAVRAIRAKKSAYVNDVDLENTSNSLKSHRLLNRSEKILDSVGINDGSRRTLEDGSYRRKALKVTFEDGDDLQNLKWTPLENQVATVKARREEVTAVRARKEDRSAEIRSETSAAAIRARQSKEKLNDIEEEMAAIAEKQAAREARVARLRALVAETEQESEALERQQAAVDRRTARREKYES